MRKLWSSALQAAMLAAALWACGSAVAQENFPNKPIRLVVPYAPGGTSDLVARYIGQKLGERWGQQVIVDNRAGGGTVIGASAVAHAPPDGYTLLLTNNTHVINPHLMANMPYDAIKDFTPVATLATSAYLLLLHPSVPAKDLKEFLALAKSRPGKLNFGTHGVGGLTHLAAELFDSMAGIKMEMVQYKGAGPALTAILAGEVDAYFDAPATTIPYIQSGKLKPVGITGQDRLATLPQVPTIAQAGLRDFDVTIWYGLLGPAGIPAPVVNKLNAEIGRILAEPEVKENLEALGVMPFSSSVPAFAQWMRTEQDKYGRVVKASNIKAN